MHKPCFTVRLTKRSHGSGSENCLDKCLFLYYVEETMCCDDPVLNPGKGVCADPVERGAILEVEGPGPPSGDSERQLSPDRGGGKT
jgi:hypothetical protein